MGSGEADPRLKKSTATGRLCLLQRSHQSPFLTLSSPSKTLASDAAIPASHQGQRTPFRLSGEFSLRDPLPTHGAQTPRGRKRPAAPPSGQETRPGPRSSGSGSARAVDAPFSSTSPVLLPDRSALCGLWRRGLDRQWDPMGRWLFEAEGRLPHLSLNPRVPGREGGPGGLLGSRRPCPGGRHRGDVTAIGGAHGSGLEAVLAWRGVEAGRGAGGPGQGRRWREPGLGQVGHQVQGARLGRGGGSWGGHSG